MNFNSKTFMGALAIVAVISLAYIAMNTRENRSLGDKVDDVVNELQDRTPVEKIQDKIDQHTDNKR
jgi:hypothetical protein